MKADVDIPLKHTLTGLKRKHGDHLGPKEPDRWEWMTIALPKYAEAGTKTLRILTDQKGLYSADPRKDPKATRYERLTHDEVLAQGLEVMDAAAVALARDNGIPIIVFSIHDPGAFVDVVRGAGRSTIVSDR